MLSGIALSLAQAMGMHSDSDLFSLSRVDLEVRRRTWWVLCHHNVRISENCGLQSHVPLDVRTKLPLHINDADLELADTETIQPRNSWTEMTLSLVKIEMAHTKLRFNRLAMETEKNGIVREQIRRYEEYYFKFFPGDSELHRLSRLGIRYIIARLGKMMYDAWPNDSQPIDESLQEPLILYNADALEISHQLPSYYHPMGWFFRCRYTQWHAASYLLIQMCHHTEGAAVDRAWEVLDAAFEYWKKSGIAFDDAGKPRSKAIRMLWEPLLRLLARAREVRKQTQHLREESATWTPSTLGTGNSSGSTAPEGPKRHPQPQSSLRGDPFVGSTEDLDTEMNWAQLDEWMQSFQDDLSRQGPDSWDYGAMGALSWW